MRRLSALLALLVTVALFARPAAADTLQLVSTGNQVVDGVYVYPYNFSIDGASTLTALMCMDYNRDISVGEKWNVTINHLALDSSKTSTLYRAEAYLFSQLGSSSNSDMQFAAWDLFDSADVQGLSGFTSNASALVNQAMAAASNQALIASGFFNGFSLYIPTSSQVGWTNGIPQEFVGAAQTPEPSSFILLGSGLVAAVGAARRKLARA